MCCRMPNIGQCRCGNQSFTGLNSPLRREFAVFLKEVERSPSATPSNWLLYYLVGRKMVFLSSDSSPGAGCTAISAVNIYYFNNFDASLGLNTVHEAFVGVRKDRRGTGLATAIREAAYQHFKKSRLSGITTRIRQDNRASIASADKLGFKLLDYSKIHNRPENELYMIRPLRS